LLKRSSFQSGAIVTVRVAAVALALAISGVAYADDDDDEGGVIGDSERIDITGRIPPECRFTETPKNTNLGNLTTGSRFDLGNLGFTCNLAELSTVNLTISSENGALKRAGGTETVAYSARWNLAAFTGFESVSAWTTTPRKFTEPSAANGVQKSAILAVEVTGPTTSLTAGDYTDTLTFTVSP
jgi:spore coat protein U-like protein